MDEMVRTEDLGKIVEMAVCRTYATPFVGPFRYADEMHRVEALLPRLARLPDLFPPCRHTAARGARYDFTTEDTEHLSVKSSKLRTAKVAPQVIGQATAPTFCERVGIPYTTDEALKVYLQDHILELLPLLEEHTFDCPNLYYNEARDWMKLIRETSRIPWADCVPTWTRPAAEWNNSCTLKLDGVSILEIQFHRANRTNLAIRWVYDAVLAKFADCFHVQDL